MKLITPSLLLLILLLGCDSKTSPPSKTPAQPAAKADAHKEDDAGGLHVDPEMLRDLRITTAEVEAHAGSEGSMLLGELRVNENSYAEISAPTPSRIVSLHANPGQSVKAGAVLAILQSTELGKARAELITAKARLDLARQVLARKQRLGEERIVPQREIQEAEANAASAEADVKAARASLRALGAAGEEVAESSQYELRSPVSGVVIDRSAIRGQMAGPEDKLFKVGDLATLWMTVQAFERDAIRIRQGSEVRMSFPAIPGSSFGGTVDFVGREVNRESRTVSVRIIVPNKDGRLRPGMSATAWVAPSSGGVSDFVITVPATSLQRVEDDWVVFLPKGQPGVFEMRKVGRGRDLGGEIEVINGLALGERIVVDGAFLLKAEAEKAHGGGERHEH